MKSIIVLSFIAVAAVEWLMRWDQAYRRQLEHQRVEEKRTAIRQINAEYYRNIAPSQLYHAAVTQDWREN